MLSKKCPPPTILSDSNQRSSNLELYRILSMLVIVAGHYVNNSGLTIDGGPLQEDFTSGNSIFLTLMGAWAKTAINCFLMITGYFMCTSKITLRKFLKLIGQIYFYQLLLYPILLAAGYETLSPLRVIQLVMPVWGFTNGFVSCFIAFWLTIPFLNILIHNITMRQHQLLIILMVSIYTVLGSIVKFEVAFNYITWFGIIYIVASYIRLYPIELFNKRCFWGWLTLISFFIGCGSVLTQRFLFGPKTGMGYFFVADCNKLFAVVVAVCSFLWFKNMNIKYSKIINAFGAGTFGVLLIHSNSDAMRTWLWQDTVDVLGHYSLPLIQLVTYSIIVVLAVFIVCNIIDQIRIHTVEKWFLHWYDEKVSAKADAWI